MSGIFKRALSWFLHTRLGLKATSLFVSCTQHRVFSPWTVRLMRLDCLRLRARMSYGKEQWAPQENRLHFGSGKRRVPGWLNVDVTDTDYLVDLGGGCLPWKDAVFDHVVSQCAVEHLELEAELLPLLRELRRVARPGAEVWLSCPDMEKVCRSYVEHKGADLLEDRLRTAKVDVGMEGVPTQHFINKLFLQDGEHKNLYDFELLQWALAKGGFGRCTRMTAEEFAARFPEFPPHHADYHSLYVRAYAE